MGRNCGQWRRNLILSVRMKGKAKNPPGSFRKTDCSFRDFRGDSPERQKRKVQQTRMFTGLFGGELGIRTLEAFRLTAFRVFYSEHTLADFEKKCPILRVNALVRKKVLSSPLRLLPTARNARELSERTNRISIKHNSRKSP